MARSPGATPNYTDVTAYKIDSTTGSLTQVGEPVLAGISPAKMIAAAPSGRFVYVLNYSSTDINIYSVDPVTGALSYAASPVPVNPMPSAIITTH